MATKNTTKKTTKNTTKTTHKKSTTLWGLNKISFWAIVTVTILYAVSLVLAAIGKVPAVVGVLMGVTEAIMIVIVAVLAWRYVRSKPMVWKVLYIICLCVVIAGIIVPRVL